MKYSILFIFTVLYQLLKVIESIPVTFHQLVVVNTSSNALLRLRAFDTTTPLFAFSIQSTPASGSLNQLSQVFSSYGYEPKMGTQITAANTIVTGSNSRVLYTRPFPDSDQGQLWDTFTYTASSLSGNSYPATVTLVPPSGSLISSNFLLSNEGWTITGNAEVSSPAVFESFSRGPLLNHYIYGTDNDINVATSGGNDNSLWYFEAPSQFMGNWGISYGGVLSFNMAAFSGNFQSLNGGNDLHVVELRCATCTGPVGLGITLAFPISAASLPSFTGAATSFSISLKETAGWLKDPQNTLKSWTTPTQCDMIQVLSRLSGMRILGDWTTWYESVALDNVRVSNTKGQIPLCAMARPDASICTC